VVLIEGLVTYVGEGFFYVRISRDTEIKIRCEKCNFREGEKGRFKVAIKKYKGKVLFFLVEGDKDA